MLKKTGWACSFAFLLVFTSQAITISGTVTNSANNQPVVGAIVTFQTLTGGNIYTDTTIPGGAYTLTGVRNVTTGYLTVTAAGYTTNRQLLAGLVATNVIDVQLNPIGIGAGTKNIQGLVTDASANAVSGAQIILLLRGGIGIFTAVDTVQSAANGDYRFDSLASGRYEMAVSKTGFLDTVVTGLNITAVDSLVLAIQLTAVGTRVGTLSGKVTSTDTSVVIANAKLLLTRTTGTGGILTIDTLDSALTNAGGVYSIANVVAGTGYRLIASAAGYIAASSPNLFRVDSGVTRIENFSLQAFIAPAGIVKGAVTDSAQLAAIQGAQVVLRRQQANFTWLRIDSMLTLANGSFSFTGLSIGTYSLIVTRADYRTYTTPANQAINLTTNPDTATVAVALVPVAKGNLIVFVHDNANAAIAGASVSAVQRLAGGALGQTYSGTTAANGWVTFSAVIAGSYDVTASKAGFNTATSAGNTVAANANDTVRMTLNTATGTSKVVKGTITSGDATLPGAVVTLTARTGGGAVLTLVDTSKANGTYSIVGIPAGYMTASLSVAKSGFVTRDSTGISIANDTTTVVISLTAVVNVVTSSSHVKAELRVTLSRSGIYLHLGDANLPTHVALYTASGKLVIDRTVAGTAASFMIPKTWSNQVMLLTVRQGSRIIRQKVNLQ